MKQNKTFCVYILANRSGSTYVGMTSDLYGRMIKHREGLIPGYTLDRNIKRLVYFEAIEDAYAAVTRERQIKKWRRSRKLALVESVNPSWEDLFPAFRTDMSLKTKTALVEDLDRRSKLAEALTSVAEPPSSG
jgi:putative endonuclease